MLSSTGVGSCIRTVIMPAAALPFELFEAVISNPSLDQSDWAAPPPTPHNCRDVAEGLLYRSPVPYTYAAALKLHVTLSRRESIASHVRTLWIRHAALFPFPSQSAALDWHEPLDIPTLPNCRDLRITATRQKYLEGFTQLKVKSIDFATCLHLASKCPELEQLSIQYLGRTGFTQERSSSWAPQIPPKLKTLYLERPSAWVREFQNEMFWVVCSPWIKNLHVNIASNRFFSEGFMAVLCDLQIFHIDYLDWNYGGHWQDNVASCAKSLELLEGPLDAISPGKHYPCLHTMAIRVLPVMDEYCPVELTHYSNAIAEGRLPSLKFLDFQITNWAPRNEEPLDGRMDRLGAIVKEIELDRLCKGVGIELKVYGALLRGSYPWESRFELANTVSSFLCHVYEPERRS